VRCLRKTVSSTRRLGRFAAPILNRCRLHELHGGSWEHLVHSFGGCRPRGGTTIKNLPSVSRIEAAQNKESLTRAEMLKMMDSGFYNIMHDLGSPQGPLSFSPASSVSSGCVVFAGAVSLLVAAAGFGASSFFVAGAAGFSSFSF
jgi:hypothetical protein